MQIEDCRLQIETARCCVLKTSLGWMGLAGRDGKLIRCVLPKTSPEEAVAGLAPPVGAGFEIPPQQEAAGLSERGVEDVAAFGDLPVKLRNYFAGERVDFSDAPTDLPHMPEFSARVLRACQAIPYGRCVSYAELAREVGAPNAARAVGNAMARNPMPIIIPCHRVLASNGGIGGFSAGIEWKTRLLRLEGVDGSSAGLSFRTE